MCVAALITRAPVENLTALNCQVGRPAAIFMSRAARECYANKTLQVITQPTKELNQMSLQRVEMCQQLFSSLSSIGPHTHQAIATPSHIVSGYADRSAIAVLIFIYAGFVIVKSVEPAHDLRLRRGRSTTADAL
eukprot:1160186-Pelagomonas_calceolata.AAC.8